MIWEQRKTGITSFRAWSACMHDMLTLLQWHYCSYCCPIRRTIIQASLQPQHKWIWRWSCLSSDELYKQAFQLAFHNETEKKPFTYHTIYMLILSWYMAPACLQVHYGKFCVKQRLQIIHSHTTWWSICMKTYKGLGGSWFAVLSSSLYALWVVHFYLCLFMDFFSV